MSARHRAAPLTKPRAALKQALVLFLKHENRAAPPTKPRAALKQWGDARL